MLFSCFFRKLKLKGEIFSCWVVSIIKLRNFFLFILGFLLGFS